MVYSCQFLYSNSVIGNMFNVFQVCAPHWYGSKKMYNKESYLPVGNCFAATSPSYDFKFFSPPLQVDSSKYVMYGFDYIYIY